MAKSLSMNLEFKKKIKKILNRLFKHLNNRQRAYVATFFSKILIDFKNRIEFDQNLNLYYLIYDNIYLDISHNPNFDFKFETYTNRMKNIFLNKYSPKQGDVVIDIGGGIGNELFFYSKGVKFNGQIHIIEANPNSFIILNKLSKKNRLSNVSSYNLAIMDKSSEIWIEQNEAFNSNQINDKMNGIKVQGITLDQFVSQNNITKINLLKANIEGAELELIKGMNESIDIVENIAISCHDFIFDGDTEIKKTVINFFEKHNFKISINNSGNEIIDSWIYGNKK